MATSISISKGSNSKSISISISPMLVLMRLLLLLLLMCSAVASTMADRNAQIFKYDNDNIGTDGYSFSFETSDGISRQETATLKNPGTAQEAISVQGSVNWVGPDGVHYTLNYLANENGFQPEGKHLPMTLDL